jgi:NADH:ubiquinone oxidoreductase subunit 3 (subunit A)
MLSVLAFIIISTIITCIILVIIYTISIPAGDYEKKSAYECGFEPFGDARSFFDIHFYIVGLLFIIFDLEILFLVPLAANLPSISPVAYCSFLFFMLVLIAGFYYEWALGLLNWVKH